MYVSYNITYARICNYDDFQKTRISPSNLWVSFQQSEYFKIFYPTIDNVGLFFFLPKQEDFSLLHQTRYYKSLSAVSIFNILRTINVTNLQKSCFVLTQFVNFEALCFFYFNTVSVSVCHCTNFQSCHSYTTN